MKKARLRLMRDARLNAALDTRVGGIQSSLESINVQLKSLSDLSKGLGCIDEFSKERLATRSRDNLRIEGLKKLYRLACGNLKFVSGIEVDECILITIVAFCTDEVCFIWITPAWIFFSWCSAC